MALLVRLLQAVNAPLGPEAKTYRSAMAAIEGIGGNVENVGPGALLRLAWFALPEAEEPSRKIL